MAKNQKRSELSTECFLTDFAFLEVKKKFLS